MNDTEVRAAGSTFVEGSVDAGGFTVRYLVAGDGPVVLYLPGAGGPVITPQGPDPITGPTGGSAAIVLVGAAEEDDLVDTSFSRDPLIEEPVTSGGESSLWECDDDDDDGDCDDRDD